MNDIFFNKTDIHGSLVRHNSGKIRNERIAKAQQSLDSLKIEIDRRQQKFDEVLNFLNQKKIEYQHLCEQYATNSRQTYLTKDISRLQEGITHLTEKIKDTQPEKIQANLRVQYDSLKNILLMKIDNRDTVKKG